MTLRNDGPSPVTAQSRVFRWSQIDGQDNLQSSRDIVVSPPAVLLAPGVTQVIRVVQNRALPSQGKRPSA
jgi:fimbrial chaperone protein